MYCYFPVVSLQPEQVKEFAICLLSQTGVYIAHLKLDMWSQKVPIVIWQVNVNTTHSIPFCGHPAIGSSLRTINKVVGKYIKTSSCIGERHLTLALHTAICR